MAQHYAFLESEALQRALSRIGYFRHTKKDGQEPDYISILSWFVALGNLNTSVLTPAEHLLIREEYRALQQEACNLNENDQGVQRHFSQTQKTIADYLSRLTQTGQVDIGPIQFTVSIHIPRFDPRIQDAMSHAVYASEHAERFEGKGLVLLFMRSLQHEGDRLRKCEHCSRLFVQMRRKQRYCRRECQQVAAMRSLRTRTLKPHHEQRRRKNGAKKRTR